MFNSFSSFHLLVLQGGRKEIRLYNIISYSEGSVLIKGYNFLALLLKEFMCNPQVSGHQSQIFMTPGNNIHTVHVQNNPRIYAVSTKISRLGYYTHTSCFDYNRMSVSKQKRI